MRRYWFSIALPVFIAASIGTYYVGKATRDLPDYKLQSAAGDAREAKDLVFEGEAKFNKLSRYQLQIGIDGASYEGKKSMIGQIIEADYAEMNPDIARLKKANKSFARGKGSFNGFYADTNKLAYALAKRSQGKSLDGRDNYSILIYTLDVDSGKKRHFEAVLPEKQKFSSFYIYDVQASPDNRLKLLVQQSEEKLSDMRGGSLKSEIHLYTIDLDKEGIAGDQTIAADKALGGGKAEQYTINEVNANVASPSDYAFIVETTVRISKDADGNTNERDIVNRYAVYDYASAKLTPVAGGEGKGSKDNGALYVNGDKLIALSMNGSELHVQSSDLPNGEVLRSLTSLSCSREAYYRACCISFTTGVCMCLIAWVRKTRCSLRIYPAARWSTRGNWRSTAQPSSRRNEWPRCRCTTSISPRNSTRQACGDLP
ncbi:hypothetical protein [Paenibacillus sp. R14(2021)]|uniref:hypothetical protein n=1 Tax=Paenibacillus sp. R14(2021) TaxID=2859228 RepID=UPI001C61541F|nr:hypothetical protein [Paenibacillus sp. R14(2021)]